MTENENTKDQHLEFAESEFNRMAQVRDLEIDTEDMLAEDLHEFKKLKKKIVRAISENVITIDDDGQITVNMRKSPHVSSVTFKTRDGSMMLGSDKFKASQATHKTYGLMAQMTGTAVSTFSKMVDPDLGLCEAVFLLLMG